MAKKNIFVVGWDDFNFQHNLDSLLHSPDYELHELLSWKEVKGGPRFRVKEAMDLATQRLEEWDGPVDAIVGYWDFPVCLMLPLLCQRQGLPTAPAESVFACEHKYWARVEQERCVEELPLFAPLDPFAEASLQRPPLPYPFWLKPVTAYLGQLGFRVKSDEDLKEAVETIREKIPRFGEPCNYLLDQVRVPPEVAGVDGYHCVAEGLISGRQCTIEGYAYAKDIVAYGVVDSYVYPGTSVFSRLQYPSKLPAHVKQRMARVTERFLRHVGYNHGPFNIEYYWDEETDDLWLLEVNARISQSHSNLFKKVDGVSHHKIMIQLALGEQPEMPQGQGPYNCAAKFMYSVFEDGYVKHAPEQNELQRVREEIPDVVIKPLAVEGELLSSHRDRDAYSFPLAEIWLGAQDEAELLQKYEQCTELLPYNIQR